MKRTSLNNIPLWVVWTAIAVSSLAAGIASQLIGAGARPIPQTALRAELLSKKSLILTSKMLSANRNLHFSRCLYDVTIKDAYQAPLPWAGEVLPDQHGKYSFLWRVKLERTSDITVNISPEHSRGEYSVRIADESGIVRYYRNQMMILNTEKVRLSPGLYAVDVTADFTLDRIRFESALSEAGMAKKDARDQAVIPGIDFVLDDKSEKILARLVKTARNYPSATIIKTPNERVDARLQSKEKPYDLPIRIGLSGRTREHLDYFPSVDVRVNGRNAFMGMTSFKLYKLQTKSYLDEMVFLSILKDMGYIVPRQFLIMLSVNGINKGLYYLMENPSESYFADQRNAPGNIHGVDLDQMFFDYPYGARAVGRVFYTNPDEKRGTKTEVNLYSRSSFKKVDSHSMAKLIAFSSVYASVHGLGIDDLRFYEDPVTHLLYPLPRDLVPAAWNEYHIINSFATHFAWLKNTPLYTIWPLKRLLPVNYKFDRKQNIFTGIGLSKADAGVTDLHPAVSDFLERTDHLALTNRFVRKMSEDKALYQKISARMIHAYVTALQYQNDIAFKSKLARVIKNGIQSLGAVSAKEIQKNILRFKSKDGDYLWNIRSAEKLDEELLPSFSYPIFAERMQKGNKESLFYLSFLLEKNLFSTFEQKSIIFPKRSFRTVNKDEQIEYDAIDVSLLSFEEDPEQKSRGPDNVVTFFGDMRKGGETYLIFLVRNATEGFTCNLKPRDGITARRPFINERFTLLADRRNHADETEIVANYFLAGEPLQWIVFKIQTPHKPFFYELDIKGAGRIFYPPVMYLPAMDEETETAQSIAVPENIIIKDKLAVIGKDQSVHIAGHLVLPEGTGLFVEEGAKILFEPEASLTVRGDFTVNGAAGKPVIFKNSRAQPWAGLLVAGSSEHKVRVRIQNASFQHYGQFPKTHIADYALNGSITFRHTRAHLENVDIDSMEGEDGINFIASDVLLRSVHLRRAVSDGIDLDFCNAKIENLIVEDSQGDGLDLSGSRVVCSESSFRRNKDKGISIGEGSNAVITDCLFEKNNFGIANKDQSKLLITNSHFSGNNIAIAEFIKKPYFGKPAMKESKNRYTANRSDYKWLGFFEY